MCIRMNNVSSLLPCSEVFFKKLASVFSYEWSQVSPTCTGNECFFFFFLLKSIVLQIGLSVPGNI